VGSEEETEGCGGKMCGVHLCPLTIAMRVTFIILFIHFPLNDKIDKRKNTLNKQVTHESRVSF